MAGIYIHIPFCRRKCHYCNFFSLASKKFREPFLEALEKEIILTKDYLACEPVGTIYFGGGTPSVYAPADLNRIVELITEIHSLRFSYTKTNFPEPDTKIEPFMPGTSVMSDPASNQQMGIKWHDDAGTLKSGPATQQPEITLELNPEDVDEAYVSALAGTRFNRFSLGIQSFFADDLERLNRIHSSGQATNAVKLLQAAGYRNISIDLIYGIPGADIRRWRDNLEIAFSLDVPHISAYALTVEPGTALAWMIRERRSAPVSDDSVVSQFQQLMKTAEYHGFEQYEISNFARPGCYSIHNKNYWKGVPYLGLGPSAHSYNGSSRRWNVSALSEYIHAISTGQIPFEEEILSIEQRYNEYLMTSLRTKWGVDSRRIIADFGDGIYDQFRTIAEIQVNNGYLKQTSEIFVLTDRGKLFADRVASEMFLV